MYKTIATVIPAGATISNPVEVPGTLIGVGVVIGGVSMTVNLQIAAPVANVWCSILVNNTQVAATATGNVYLGVNFQAPVGPTQYRIVAASSDPGNRDVVFYYDDMPNLLR